MDWNLLLGALVALFGGLNIFQFIFLRSTKKSYEARAEKERQEAKKVENQNESAAMQTLKDAITFMSEQNRENASDKMALSNQVDELLKDRQQKDETIATLLTMICKHMGCGAREPIPGQGRVWFENNKQDFSMGIDYLPINQLMKRYGAKKRESEKHESV